MKIFVCIVLLLIVAIFILILLLKSKDKKYKDLNYMFNSLEKDYEQLEKTCVMLKEEKEIEISQKKELAEKLANISCMSIDDILKQLQHDN